MLPTGRGSNEAFLVLGLQTCSSSTLCLIFVQTDSLFNLVLYAPNTREGDSY